MSCPVAVRRWALWQAPPLLVGWVLFLVIAAAASTVVGLLGTRADGTQVLACLFFAGCGAVCVEATRRAGEPAGVAKDLMSAWTLPVALLLPPVYSLLVPVPLTVLAQVRVRWGLPHRRVFSVAAIGLSNVVASLAFHDYLRRAGGGRPWSDPLSTAAWGRASVVGVAVGCAVLGCALNVLLVGTAVRLASAETRWRELLADREQRMFDLGEICLGVAVAGCWVLSPLLALAMLVPVLLVQRSLTHTQLRAAARTDAKTGLLNSGAWRQEAEREVVRAHRAGEPLAVLLADLDHFKRVNDIYGHLGGDEALQAAAAALRDGLRPYDQLGRFGGEEFTAVLPHTGRADAVAVAERLRVAVEAARVVLDGVPVEISVSIGVAVLGEHGDDLTDLLAAADHALYRAKASGRNRVTITA